MFCVWCFDVLLLDCFHYAVLFGLGRVGLLCLLYLVRTYLLTLCTMYVCVPAELGSCDEVLVLPCCHLKLSYMS